jgi:hypothetical protein
MTRYDIMIGKQPEIKPESELPPSAKDIEINKIPVSDLEVNLKKLNFSSGDLLVVQFQEPQTSDSRAEIFSLVKSINTFILRTPPVYAIVLNPEINLRTLSSKELKKIGLQRIKGVPKKKDEFLLNPSKLKKYLG